MLANDVYASVLSEWIIMMLLAAKVPAMTPSDQNFAFSFLASFLPIWMVWCRERAASMYSCAPYATASGFVELPYLFLQSAVFVPIAYWMIGFEANAAKFFFFWLVFLMALTLNTFLGQLLVIVTPNQQLGQLLGSGNHALAEWLVLLLHCCLRLVCRMGEATLNGGYAVMPYTLL